MAIIEDIIEYEVERERLFFNEILGMDEIRTSKKTLADDISIQRFYSQNPDLARRYYTILAYGALFLKGRSDDGHVEQVGHIIDDVLPISENIIPKMLILITEEQETENMKKQYHDLLKSRISFYARLLNQRKADSYNAAAKKEFRSEREYRAALDLIKTAKRAYEDAHVPVMNKSICLFIKDMRDAEERVTEALVKKIFPDPHHNN